MARRKRIDPKLLDLVHREYDHMMEDDDKLEPEGDMDWDRSAMDILDDSDIPRNNDGFIVLTPTQKSASTQVDHLTTNIDTLQEKLNRFRAEREQLEAVKEKGPEAVAKDDNSWFKKNKKAKKRQKNLIENIFNNSDSLRMEDPDAEDDEEENQETEESNTTNKKKKKKPDIPTTLDTTYGRRFSPVVAMLYDTVVDFDSIAEEIEKELRSKAGSMKGMYRSSQMGNLISAKNSKLSAVKELASISKTISDLEYKKEKDAKANEDQDTSSEVAVLGAKYLRSISSDDDGESFGKSKKKKKKKDKDKKDQKKFKEKSKSSWVDDDDDSVVSNRVSEMNTKSDREQADAVAKMLLGRRSDIKLDPYEYNIAMEGKYNFVVVADQKHPEDDWEFVAVDPETGKKIKGFKDNYKDLYPKKKLCRMTFSFDRMKAIDKNSNKTYQLILK